MGAWRNLEYPFVAILTGVVAIDKVLYKGQIELFDI